MLQDDLSVLGIVKWFLGTFSDERKITDVQNFFKAKNLDIEKKNDIQNVFQLIRINAAWLKRDGQMIKDYLVKHQPK